MCKSAALPGSNLGVIEVPFRGRTVKIAGDRTFDTWTATFFNDKDMEIRALFEDWANSINSHEDNTAPRFLPNGGADGYMAELFVSQLEKDAEEGGSVLRSELIIYITASQLTFPQLILLMIAMIRLQSLQLNGNIRSLLLVLAMLRSWN